MKRKFILLLFMIFLYLSIPTNTSHAKSISSLEKIVSNGQVTLKLNEPGDTYKFIKNGELVYKGPSNTFKSDISNIGDKYKIGIYQKNKLKGYYSQRNERQTGKENSISFSKEQ